MPSVDADGAEHGVAAGDERQAVLHRGRGVNLALRLHFPPQRPGARLEGIEMPVVRADQHHVIHEHRRRLDLRAGLERPEARAIAHADRVDDPAKVADVHGIGADGRRRLADQVAGRVFPRSLPEARSSARRSPLPPPTYTTPSAIAAEESITSPAS